MKTHLLFLAGFQFLVSCKNTNTDTNQKETPPKHTTEQTDNEPQSEWLAIPNQKVGKITSDMKEADIIEAYGQESVKRDSLHVGEGFYIQSTVVFPDTPKELRIAWEEDKTFEKIARIIVRQENAPWHTPEGLKIGSSLQEVIDLNGTHFNFWGFDWDYAGSVSSWEGGNFDGKGLGVRLNYQVDFEELDSKAVEAVIGDREVSSNEPILKEMQVVVSELFFYFPK